jgi:homoserine dehydrogenase
MKLSVLHQDDAAPAEPAEYLAEGHEPLLVLKFGSSVLASLDDLPAVAGEIYRQRRNGNRIIAVVSALGDETDRLISEAAQACDGVACSGAAELISLGEDRTAALLKIACERIGLAAAICRAEELGLHANGQELDANFVSLSPFVLNRKLESHGAVIVPGFVGLSDDGARKLLGRGGSDFTAAILGGELAAKTVRLYKDVDGVFEADPASNPDARKYDAVTYEDALKVASPLVHSKALNFAADKGLAIEVETIGSSSPTRIGETCALGANAAPARPTRIALAGYGVVGQALARRLVRDPRFSIEAILVRDVDRCRGFAPPVRLTNDVHLFAQSQADVLIELLSCETTGTALCAARLRTGVPVVTASKRIVAEKYDELCVNAEAGRAPLLYSAAVGGSTPILEAVDREKLKGEIAHVRGILNGTVNYVLQRLADGIAFDDALARAREAGFAEEDSEADLSGADAACKLKLIATHAFGISPREVSVSCERLDRTLADHIRASGERWIQLSEVCLSDGAVTARVRLLPAAEAGIWAAPNEWNVAVITCAGGIETCVRGRGAGGAATAEAVLADLYDLLGEKFASAPASLAPHPPRPADVSAARRAPLCLG